MDPCGLPIVSNTTFPPVPTLCFQNVVLSPIVFLIVLLVFAFHVAKRLPVTPEPTWDTHAAANTIESQERESNLIRPSSSPSLHKAHNRESSLARSNLSSNALNKSNRLSTAASEISAAAADARRVLKNTVVRSTTINSTTADDSSLLLPVEGTPDPQGVGSVDIARMLVLVCCILVPLIGVTVVSLTDSPQPWDEWLHAAATSATALLCLLLVALDARWQVQSVFSLTISWALVVALQSLQLYTRISMGVVRSIDLSSFVHSSLVILAFWTIILFKDPSRQYLLPDAASPQVSPEANANLWSSLFFMWLNPLLSLGYSRALSHEDLFVLHPLEKCSNAFWRLRTYWTEALPDDTVDEHRSLRAALRQAFGGTFLLGMVFKLMYDSLLFVGPILLNLTLQWLKSQNTDSPRPQSEGLM
jgi:hypothetical protein